MDRVIVLATRPHSGYSNAYATPNKKPVRVLDMDKDLMMAMGYDNVDVAGIMDRGLNAESDDQ